MLSGARLLIVEDEFLIALDMQRVLEAAHALQVVFARNYDEVAALGERMAEFDFAIVPPPRPMSGEHVIAAQLASAGPAIVVCSAARLDLSGTSLAAAEIIDKPFADDDLLAACQRALEKRTAP